MSIVGAGLRRLGRFTGIMRSSCFAGGDESEMKMPPI